MSNTLKHYKAKRFVDTVAENANNVQGTFDFVKATFDFDKRIVGLVGLVFQCT